MAYTAIPADHVKALNARYKAAKDNLAKATVQTEKNRLTGLMKLLSSEVVDNLNDDMATLTTSFAAHQKAIDALVIASQKDLKAAKETTAKYKSSPRPEFPPQITYFATKMRKAVDEAQKDALAFGDAWKGYRENVAKDVPPADIAAPEAKRKAVINNSKITAAKIVQLKAAADEAETLIAIVGKATRKRVEGVDRPVERAQQAAKEFSKKMADLLVDVRTPPGRGAQPNSIRSGSDSLVKAAANAQLTANPANLSDNEGRWATVDASWKGLSTRAASMAKIYADGQKGFRSTELKDPVVKGEMVKAAKSLSEAQADVKMYAPMYAKAKVANDKIKAAFAKKNKKK